VDVRIRDDQGRFVSPLNSVMACVMSSRRRNEARIEPAIAQGVAYESATVMHPS
jgi:hypothetical protein